jgi:hypothetical protein
MSIEISQILVIFYVFTRFFSSFYIIFWLTECVLFTILNNKNYYYFMI